MKINNINRDGLVGFWTLNESDLTVGENIITNGYFISDVSGFGNYRATLSWNAGQYCEMTQNSGITQSMGITQTTILTVGKTYKIQYKAKAPVETVTPLLLTAYWDDIQYLNCPALTTSWQTYEFIATAKTVSAYILSVPAVSDGAEVDIDDIVIREIDTAIKGKSGNGNDGQIIRTDLLSGWDFDDGSWTEVSATADDDDSFTTTAEAGGIAKSLLTVGRKYRIRISGVTNATYFEVYQSTSSAVRIAVSSRLTGTFVESFEFTAQDILGGESLYLRNVGDATTTDITTFTLEDITFEQDQNGVPNQAQNFDGVGDYITLTNTQSLTGDFTISTWGKWNIENGQALVGNSAAYNYVFRYISDGLYYIRTDDGTSISDTFSSTGIVYNDWNHYVVKRSGDNVYIYINNILSKSGSGFSGKTLTIDSIGRTSIAYFDGFISDVAIYNKALTRNEISKLYLAGRSTAKVKVDAKNLVSDADFVLSDGQVESTVGTYWTTGAGWTIGSGTANANTSSTSDFSQSGVLTIGNTYRVSYTVLNRTQGTVEFYTTGYSPVPRDADGRYNETFISVGQNIYFTARSNLIGSIDNIEIVDITNKITPKLQKGLILDMPLHAPYTKAGSDLVSGWDFTSGWSLTGLASTPYSDTFVTTGNGGIYKDYSLAAGKTYIFTYLGSSNASASELYIESTLTDNKVMDLGDAAVKYTIPIGLSNNNVYLRNTGAGTTNITTLEIKELDGTTLDKTPNQNNGIVSGATLQRDGLVASTLGVAYIPSTIAYGTWEFYIYHTAGRDCVSFMANIISTNEDDLIGYSFVITSDEKAALIIRNPTSVIDITGAGYVDENTLYRFKIIRTNAGVFYYYIKGGSFGWDDWTEIGHGTNTSHTTSTYLLANSGSTLNVSDLYINGKPISLAKANISSGTWLKTGPSYEFDGTDDFISLGSELTLNNATTSISLWFQSDQSVSAFKCLLGRSDLADDNYMAIYNDAGVYKFYLKDDTAIGFYFPGMTLMNADNDWHNLVVLMSSTPKLYLDGNYIGAGAQQGNIYINRIGIGRDGTRDWSGQISRLKIWNRILTTDEITYLFNKERHIYGI